MALSSKEQLDRVMTEETQKTFSPFTLTIKHVQCLKRTGKRFIFVLNDKDGVAYDTVPVRTTVEGRPCKRRPFLLTDTVRQRLVTKQYVRWYFEDDDYVYPLQQCKVDKLLSSFPWVPTTTDVNTCVLPPIHETPFLRKKPLVGVRPATTSWEHPPTVTVAKVTRRQLTAVTC